VVPQTFNLKTHGQLKPNFWNTETFDSETFKSAINNFLIGDLSTKQNLEKEALRSIEHIAKTKQLITKKQTNEKGQIHPLLNQRLT
jgi:hypothetical protein